MNSFLFFDEDFSVLLNIVSLCLKNDEGVLSFSEFTYIDKCCNNRLCLSTQSKQLTNQFSKKGSL